MRKGRGVWLIGYAWAKGVEARLLDSLLLVRHISSIQADLAGGGWSLLQGVFLVNVTHGLQVGVDLVKESCNNKRSPSMQCVKS